MEPQCARYEELANEKAAAQKASKCETGGRTSEEARREFERIWPKIRKIQERIRRERLANHMLTDDDLYDENGLPK